MASILGIDAGLFLLAPECCQLRVIMRVVTQCRGRVSGEESVPGLGVDALPDGIKRCQCE